jgi:hypothetical protein
MTKKPVKPSRKKVSPANALRAKNKARIAKMDSTMNATANKKKTTKKKK